MRSTKKALDTSDALDYTGLDGVVAIKEVNGVKVAFLGFSPYPWSPSIADIPGAQALVRDAATKAPDVVVVIMYAGAEGADKTHHPQIRRERLRRIPRKPASVLARGHRRGSSTPLVGSGPHVVRGMEQYRGRVIAYSLGNFAGWRNFGPGAATSLCPACSRSG